MQFRTLGKTEKKVSILGFGTMRLPVVDNQDDKIDEEKAIALIRQGIDAGINYIDTAFPYHGGNSEIIVGKALKDGYRDKVYLATKLPMYLIKEESDFEKYLDQQLIKLDVNKIDFYFLHALDKSRFEDIVLKYSFIEKGLKARAEGKIGHLCFSFHDSPDVLKTIIDTDAFDVMLVQYNLLDQSNAEMIDYAKSKNMGVIIMGPVAGGRLGEPAPEAKAKLHSEGRKTFNPEIALKFVWSNKNVDIALSGMGTSKMIEDNIQAANDFVPFSQLELNDFNRTVAEYKALSNLYCSGCKYCIPCPQNVNIPLCFDLMNYYRVYGAEEFAKKRYLGIGVNPFIPGKPASECTECGICEEKCPQKIPIREQLKQVKAILG